VNVLIHSLYQQCIFMCQPAMTHWRHSVFRLFVCYAYAWSYTQSLWTWYFIFTKFTTSVQLRSRWT